MPLTTFLKQETTSKDATRMKDSFADKGSVADLGIGSVIKHTYELVEVLGEGGMGTVFKALNRVWAGVEARDPYVALKILKPELATNEQLVRGLFSDFDRTRVLAECPNIIKVYGFDKDGSHVYMTMEYLTGKTLADYLNSKPMTLAHAWFIIEGIGNALAYAHQKNIVHRDIKPGNIIITHDNLVKVLDFGIASKINETEGDETLFSPHELGAFTKAYASPEMQLDYAPDVRDDIYAFACVIYEILTGTKFFKPGGRSDKASPIQSLNTRQMEALNKALAFVRTQRTGSIRELLDNLHPDKMPWAKYGIIGGGVFIILGLAAWGAKELVIPPDVNRERVSQTALKTSEVMVVPVTTPAPVSSSPQAQIPVIAPVPVQQSVTVATVSKPQVLDVEPRTAELKPSKQDKLASPSSPSLAQKKPKHPITNLHTKTVSQDQDFIANNNQGERNKLKSASTNFAPQKPNKLSGIAPPIETTDVLLERKN